MSKRKTLPLNKSYYGGIYIYFKKQKLTKTKENTQTQNGEGIING
jgi:hypothetical protein